MSSMDISIRRRLYAATLLVGSAALPSSGLLANAQPSAEAEAAVWDNARSNMVARQPSQISRAVDRWETLRTNDNLSFEDYAGFVLAYPGFPQEERLRTRAEGRLDDEIVAPERLIAFFDANPPLTNAARARYALALAGAGRSEAMSVAREAWRGGRMDGVTEAYLQGRFGKDFSAADNMARLDALLWQGETEAADRMLLSVPAGQRPLYQARLALAQGRDPATLGLNLPTDAYRDAGYVYNLAKYYRGSGQSARATNLFATRPQVERPAFDQEAFVGEALRAARGGTSTAAAQIAARVDDIFPANTDISTLSYRLRDDYTSLMWLGGTSALWTNGNGSAAAPLFYRYGTAAQTPQTRSKGFYWAGLASERAGNRSEATRYYELAAAYPERFYGQLALEKLGRDFPTFERVMTLPAKAEDKRAFEAQPLTQAVREVARGAPWRTGIQFYREMAQNADTEAEHIMVSDLAREIGRRDLAVNMAEAAGADGVTTLTRLGYPTMRVPGGTDWTIAHAITRQESQFAQNAISHANARGLMQLIPSTAREQAGKLGMQYMSASLIDDPEYNIRLGSGYFARMLDYYNGAYPLAIAAYNAGPGNVNKWLRANGDPRTGSIDYVTWVERIPIFETKNYVHRVIENAAMYEQLYPEKARTGKPRTANDFLNR